MRQRPPRNASRTGKLRHRLHRPFLGRAKLILQAEYVWEMSEYHGTVSRWKETGWWDIDTLDLTYAELATMTIQTY